MDPMKVTTTHDPQVEADRILQGVWTKIAGVVLIPVDPVRIASELGIDVFSAELGGDVSGAIVKSEDTDATILVNQADSASRRRFTTAHELGHYVAHAQDPDEYKYVDYRGELASQGSDPEEVFANQFAANLLMPEAEVRKWYAKGLGLVEMAFEFRVSQEAMT